MRRTGLTAVSTKGAALLLLILCAGLVHPVVGPCLVGTAHAQNDREAALIRVLESAVGRAEKDKACRELQTIGTRACIPAVAALLDHERLSHLARRVLEPMPYPEAAAALRAALPVAAPARQIGIANSLGFRRDEAAAPLLIPLLSSPSAGVVEAAACALGRIATPTAVKALGGLRATATTAQRPVAGDASLMAAERLLQAGDAARAEAIYTELQTDPWPRHIRLGAFVGFLRASPDNAADAALQAIQGDDPERRGAAIAGVRTLERDALNDTIIAHLPTLPSAVQVLLIDVLARRGPDMRAPILALGQNADDAVTTAAAQALGRIGDASCVPWLARVAGAGGPRRRDAASRALVALKGYTVEGAIREAVLAAEADARARLIAIIMRREDTGSIDLLLSEAAHADSSVRKAALRALATLAPADKLPALIALLAAPQDAGTRAEAERAAALTVRRNPDRGGRGTPVLTALGKTTDAATRCSLLRVLGAIGGARELAAVTAALGAPGADEKDAAARALADWPDPDALQPLYDLSQQADSRLHRVLALRGLIRLLSPPTDLSATVRAEWFGKLAEQVTDAASRKMVLAGLAHVGHPDALALAMDWFDGEETRAEAVLAAVTIGEAVAALDSQAVRAAMETVAKRTDSDALRKRARAVVRSTRKFEDYIVGWLISGPYRQNGRPAAALFDVPLAPEKDDGNEAGWKLLPPKSRTDDAWMMDLNKALGGTQCVGYALTWIHSERARDARFEIGVDDGIKVWVNDKVVHRNNSSGAATAAEEMVDVTLVEGWNRCLFKIIQHTGPWEFCARLRTRDGKELPGIRINPLQRIPGGALSANTTGAAPAPAPPATTVSTALENTDSFKDDTGWTPLFNGTDLAGWTKTGNGEFGVEDELLFGTQTDGKGGNLWAEGQWGDFEMRVVYRMTWPANSGFWFRHDGRKGYQYDVLKWKKPVAFSGTLYCPGKMFITRNLDESIEKRDDWNEAWIRAEGDAIALWLNGVQTGSCRDSTLRRGRIGIQVHGGDGFKGMRIEISRFEIRPLPRQAATGPIPFTPHRVGRFRSEACDVGDIDGDDKLDIIAGPIWYQAPDWVPHRFRELEGKVGEDGKGYHDDFMNGLMDVDGDGKLDLVTCCWFAKQLRWYKGRGAQAGPWTMAVAGTDGNYETGELCDVDGDGKALEIVPAIRGTCWYERVTGNDGTGRFARHSISDKRMPFGASVGDINGDGCPDILRPAAWFEAPEDPRSANWVEHPWAIGSPDGKADHTPRILVYDVNRDGRNDVITSSAHKRGIFWYEQAAAGSDTPWVQHLIDDSWTQAHSLALADMDADGDLDLVAGKRFMAHNGGDPGANDPLGVYWYQLERDGAPHWTRHAITHGQGIGSGLNLCVVDLDGDTDLDVVVTGKWGGPVWFENGLK